MFVGWATVSFDDPGGGGRRYMGVVGETLACHDSMWRAGGGAAADQKPKDAAVWGFYRRGRYNAVGFRSALTDRWMGQDFWGNIAVKR